MTELHHVGIRVGDLDAAVRLLRKAFDVEIHFDSTGPVGGPRIAYVELNNCRLELVADRELQGADRAAAIDHIAIGSCDLRADMAELSRRGFTSLDRAPRVAAFGNRVAAYDPADFLGIKLHLVTEKGDE